MKARLTKYAFNRPFQLEKDLDRQDKLATWIEYLGYEYYYYDEAMSMVKRMQPQFDAAWQKLVDSNCVRPEDTYDGIRDDGSAYERWQPQ